MSELIFKSSLTTEEIEENFKNVDFFSGIMDGLQEALAYSKDNADDIRSINKLALAPESF